MKGLICSRCDGILRCVQTFNVEGLVRTSIWCCSDCGHRESKVLLKLDGISAQTLAAKLRGSNGFTGASVDGRRL